ncbi:hypothetical protein HPP92_022940 [Vanilla planifolia]|uniref:Uncharacterized protein n=1 Tax=Vanilla planifolia TaxID=51239 RepID=A0A835PRU4_VANPL|nr:hypothetical protein HPP92_022940 [Vanilla planifolia]
MNAIRAYALFFVAIFFSGLMQLSNGQASSKPSQLFDGKTIDLGIAYVITVFFFVSFSMLGVYQSLQLMYRFQMNAIRAYAFFFAAFFFSGLMQLAHGQAVSKPSQLFDGKTIDLGIAYVLMLAALLITYIIH